MTDGETPSPDEREAAQRYEAFADHRFELGKFPAKFEVELVIQMLANRNDPPRVFVRGGHLSRVRFDENDRPLIEAFARSADADALRTELERRINFGRTVASKKKDETPKWKSTAAPRDLVQSVRTSGEWPGIPALEAITEAPTLRDDGAIVDEPGYDPPSRLLYHPAPSLSVPTIARKPSRAEITAAVDQLDDVLADFPWATDSARANAYALLLTPLVRPAIAGPVPLALVSGTKAGTGKGLLVDVASRIASGRAPGLTAIPSTDEEMNKVIGALLMAGSTFIAFDEADELRSSSLALALTATVIKPRVLGQSTMVELPQRATWVACGNNIRIRGDLHRRCYWIRLDAKVARPYERAGFRHPNLTAHVHAHRGELIGAALTIARAWYAAGRPTATVPTLGGFETWTKTIGGILNHAGIEGFLADHQAENRRADEESTEWENFLTALLAYYESNPFTAGDIVTRVLANDPVILDALPDELGQALHHASPASARSRLGKALAKRRDTRYGDQGLHLIEAGAATRTGTRWKVHTDCSGSEVAEVSDLTTRVRARARTHESAGKTTTTTEPLHAGGTP